MSEQNRNLQDPATIDILYDISLKVLEKQNENIDSLNNKVGGIFAFITVSFGALSTLLVPGFQKSQAMPILIWFWIAVAVFIATVVSAYLAYRVTGVKFLFFGPKLLSASGYNSDLLKEIMLVIITRQHEENDLAISQKAKYSQMFLVLAFAHLLLMLGLAIFNASRLNINCYGVF